jgi:hypothetical protein
MKHYLKIESTYFESVLCGEKPFEIRRNDRDFQGGDTIILREVVPVGGEKEYSGRVIEAKITYVSVYAQKDGWCVLGILVRKYHHDGFRGLV